MAEIDVPQPYFSFLPLTLLSRTIYAQSLERFVKLEKLLCTLRMAKHLYFSTHLCVIKILLIETTTQTGTRTIFWIRCFLCYELLGKDRPSSSPVSRFLSAVFRERPLGGSEYRFRSRSITATSMVFHRQAFVVALFSYSHRSRPR